MAGTLALVFRMRLKLLPLALACLSCALTFGAIASLGGTLTLASIAALPVLIGLAVDYAIQFQARYAEHPSAYRRGRGAQAALLAAARLGAPSIAAAGLATVAGFLALFLSPIPMVRSFGAILIAGIVIAFLSTLTAGAAVLVRDANRVRDVPPVLPRLRAKIKQVATALAQTRIAHRFSRWVAGPASTAFARASEAYMRNLRRAAQNPGRVLAVGLCVAVLGWIADTQTQVISDVRELVPQNLQALSDVERLEHDTGIGGELDVMVSGRELTDPSVVGWMAGFQNDLLSKHGYRPGARCAQDANPPELCPALSLPDILGPNPQSQDIKQLLASVPPYLSQGVISNDHREANMAFGIRMMPLDRQRQLISDIRTNLHPPPGVKASVVGLPALAADANQTLSSTLRRDLTLVAGLAAVFLVLFALRRNARAAVVPLVPIAFASGWSALVLFLLRIPLNPLSASLGVLVIAISTEFSVLLSARYRQERDERVPPKRAVERTYLSTGKYVLASGVTATMGFAVLMSSDIRMLRDFGAVTAIDLAVSLLGVVLVLPAALVAAENEQLVESTKQGLRWLAGAIARRARLSVSRLRPGRRKQRTRV
jgi:hydrophobe/amphiphile efflux-3 (HAE3) family protein